MLSNAKRLFGQEEVKFNNYNDVKQMEETKMSNNVREQERNIFEVRTESEVEGLLELVKYSNENLKKLLGESKKDKLEFLLGLKVREIGVNFTAKVMSGEYDDESLIDNEIKNLLPQVEKVAANVLNKVKNRKLRAGKTQDKAYLASIKKDIYDTILSTKEIDELKLFLRGLYGEHHADLGMPELSLEELKALINEFIDLLVADVSVGSANIKEETIVARVNSRLVKLVKIYDNKLYDFSDMMTVLFKNDKEENANKIKAILYKMTGETKYVK